jgi:superfamily I DNA and RNA helicase
MPKKFEYLAGSLALEHLPFHTRAAELIRREFVNCEGYCAYRLTTLGRASDEEIPSFLIVTREHGVILLDLIEERVTNQFEGVESYYWDFENSHRSPSRFLTLELYTGDLISRLKNDLALYDRKARNITVPITTCAVFCANDIAEVKSWPEFSEIADIDVIHFSDLSHWLNSVPQEFQCDEEKLGRILSLLEGTFVYGVKPSLVVNPPLVTKNDFIQSSLQTVFKQDDSQRVASLQLPPGPQRIRGLAGTGKTVVLSLKAAISHKRFPDFKILYLFNTQSLYNQIQSLISRYYTVEAKKAPDFDEHVHVLHAWGGKQRAGLYSKLCEEYGITPLTWTDVRSSSDGLATIYQRFLQQAGNALEPIYDLVLIDEAQDLPPELFETVYRITKGGPEEKRIIWAYDEFQSLRDVDMKGPSELFGKNELGEPNLPDSLLQGEYEGGIAKDFVLSNCYRTPRPILMAAHGVALGLYAPKKTAMFYSPGDWTALGYRVVEPHSLMINPGDQVTLERPDENSKNKLERLLRESERDPKELLQFIQCSSEEEQWHSVAKEVSVVIREQGVAPEEVIIVNLSSGRDSMLGMQRALTSQGIKSVLPGFFESADVFKPKGYVTISTTFRAKGNEANIVFVINAHKVSKDVTLRMRNAFFVAVTRSRGWCYIAGIGDDMKSLVSELTSIYQDFPAFHFVCPSKDELPSRALLSMSDNELNKMQEIVELMKKNPELAKAIRQSMDE